MKTKGLVRSIMSTSMVSMLAVASANAQTAGSSSTDTEPAVLGLEEVVVTANRRSENVQQVPIAVSAFSADSALAHGITDMQSLANAVPGVRIDRVTGTAAPFIRGVGSPSGQASNEPPVAFYVDDVYTPAAGASMANFNSIEGLEIAKGPQGTLFGRNATGGVIQVFTKNPTPEPALDVSVGYANYDTKTASIYATGALSTTVSANIAGYAGDQGSGWGDNPTTGKDAFDANKYYGGRVKLLWQPSDSTSVLLNVDHDYTRGDQGFYGPVKGTVGAGSYEAPPGFYDLVDGTDPYWDVKQTGGSLKVTQEIGLGKFVSISGYRDTKQFQHWDQAGSPTPLILVDILGTTKTFTQEFQLLSSDDAPITWIAGLFYMHDKSGYDPLGLAGPIFAPLPYANFYGMQETNSYAAFAQTNWEIFDATHLTLGARYTIDKRKIKARSDFGGVLTVEATNSPESDTWEKPSWRIALDHQFTDDFMAYIAYNRGFKSGTFNAVVTGPTIGEPVKPEILDAYTIGQKAEFFDNRLRVNTEVFYYKYKDMQLHHIVAGGTQLTNAAEATIKGVDVDITASLFQGFTLTAAVGILDGEYDDFPNGPYWVYSPNPSTATSNVGVDGINLKGNDTINTPPFSVSLRADYVYPTSVGDLNFNLAYNHGGDYYFDPDNGEGQLKKSYDRQPKLDLIDASVSWTSSDGRYDLRLWGKNLTKEKYISFGFEESLLTQYSPAPPRTYGLTAGMHFK